MSNHNTNEWWPHAESVISSTSVRDDFNSSYDLSAGLKNIYLCIDVLIFILKTMPMALYRYRDLVDKLSRDAYNEATNCTVNVYVLKSAFIYLKYDFA